MVIPRDIRLGRGLEASGTRLMRGIRVLDPALDFAVRAVGRGQVDRLAGLHPIEVDLVQESEDDRGLIDRDFDHGDPDADHFSCRVLDLGYDPVVLGPEGPVLSPLFQKSHVRRIFGLKEVFGSQGLHDSVRFGDLCIDLFDERRVETDGTVQCRDPGSGPDQDIGRDQPLINQFLKPFHFPVQNFEPGTVFGQPYDHIPAFTFQSIDGVGIEPMGIGISSSNGLFQHFDLLIDQCGVDLGDDVSRLDSLARHHGHIDDETTLRAAQSFGGDFDHTVNQQRAFGLGIDEPGNQNHPTHTAVGQYCLNRRHRLDRNFVSGLSSILQISTVERCITRLTSVMDSMAFKASINSAREAGSMKRIW